VTDLNRFLRLAGLVAESVSDDNSINNEIEKLLQAFPADEQTRLIDALDLLKNAGKTGISVAEWVGQLRGLHPEADVATSLKSVAKTFTCCVKRVGHKRYGWIETPVERPGIDDVDPATRAAVSAQVGLTYDALAAMRAMGEFGKDDLLNWLAGRGLRGHHAAMYADHLVVQFGAVPAGPGRYRIPAEEPTTNAGSMDFLRSLAANPRDPDA
jgi:hypothetical protein